MFDDSHGVSSSQAFGLSRKPSYEMEESQRPSSITSADLISEASSYSSLTTQEIGALEESCREEIPEALSQRKQEGSAFLTKAEAQKLLEWKL